MDHLNILNMFIKNNCIFLKGIFILSRKEAMNFRSIEMGFLLFRRFFLLRKQKGKIVPAARGIRLSF